MEGIRPVQPVSSALGRFMNSSDNLDGLDSLPVLEVDPRNISTIAKGAGISFFGSIIGVVLKYAFTTIAARGLGAYTYGLFTLALTTVNLLSLIALLGLNWGVLRYVAMYRGVSDKSREWGTVFLATAMVGCSSISLAALLFFLANPIAALFAGNDGELARLLRALALSIPLLAFLTLFGAITDAHKKMQYRAVATNICQPLSAFIMFALLLFLGWRLWGGAVAYLLSTILSVGVAFYFVRAYFVGTSLAQFAPRYEVRSLVLFSFPLFLWNVLQRLINQLEVYLLGILQAAEAVGIFSVAAYTAALSTVALRSLDAIFAPMVSDFHNQGQKAELEGLLKVVTRWSILFSVPALLIAWLFAEPILAIFGRDFADGAVVLVILSVGQFVNGATGPVGTTLSMSGYPGFNLLNSVIMLIVNLGLDLWLIPRFGLVGTALGSSLSLAGVNLMRLLEVYILLGLNPYDWKSTKPVVAGLAAAAPVWLLRSFVISGSGIWPLAVSLFAFALFYVLGLFGIGLDEHDWLVLRIGVRRLKAIEG
jgi:O-antigen/teichoic acid export membrane protein